MKDFGLKMDIFSFWCDPRKGEFFVWLNIFTLNYDMTEYSLLGVYCTDCDFGIWLFGFKVFRFKFKRVRGENGRY